MSPKVMPFDCPDPNCNYKSKGDACQDAFHRFEHEHFDAGKDPYRDLDEVEWFEAGWERAKVKITSDVCKERYTAAANDALERAASDEIQEQVAGRIMESCDKNPEGDPMCTHEYVIQEYAAAIRALKEQDDE